MQGIASEPVLQFFIEQTNKRAEFQFVDILYVYMLEELLQSGEISLEEGKWFCKFYVKIMKQLNIKLVT